MKLSINQAKEIVNAIENEGFDYAINDYLDWDRYTKKDPELKQLVEEYQSARAALRDYLGVDEY